MKSSIDIIFPELEDLLNPWRKETIEIANKGVPPHISIIYPWIDSPINENDLNKVKSLLNEINSFEIEFTDIKSFDNGILYLAIKNSTFIKNIQTKLLEIFPSIKLYNGEFENPIIHLTIAKFDNTINSNSSQLYNKIQNYLPLKKKITKITIMTENENSLWSCFENISLRNISNKLTTKELP